MKYISKSKSVLVLVISVSFFSLFTVRVIGQTQEPEQGLQLTSEYNNPEIDYSFTYPEDWLIYEKLDNIFPYIKLSNFDSSITAQRNDSKYFKIEIVLLPNEKGLDINSWANDLANKSNPIPDILEKKEIVLDGHSALYQMEKVGSLVHPVVYIKRENDILILNSSANYKNFESTFEDIVQSLKTNSINL